MFSKGSYIDDLKNVHWYMYLPLLRVQGIKRKFWTIGLCNTLFVANDSVQINLFSYRFYIKKNKVLGGYELLVIRSGLLDKTIFHKL